MPTDEGDRERVTGVEGDGEREGFHFISLSFLASYTDAISFCTFANNEAILPYPNMKTNCTRASDPHPSITPPARDEMRGSSYRLAQCWPG